MLYIHPQAESCLARLEADRGQTWMLHRIEDRLDDLESDSTSAQARRQRYQAVDAWGIPFALGDENWIILWKYRGTESGDIDVVYIGLAP